MRIDADFARPTGWNGASPPLTRCFQIYAVRVAHRIRAIVTIAVTKALLPTLPAYDEGKTEPELRRAWTTRFRMLQPFERSRSN